jgi:hypothetical protein
MVHKMVDLYPDDFELVTTADGVRGAFDRGRVASLIGIEGGHQIDSSLAVLRMLVILPSRFFFFFFLFRRSFVSSSPPFLLLSIFLSFLLPSLPSFFLPPFPFYVGINTTTAAGNYRSPLTKSPTTNHRMPSLASTFGT